MQLLLVECQAEACRAARRKFLAGVRSFSWRTSAEIGDFLRRRLTLTKTGGLRCDGSEADAFGFVTGYLPAGLRAAIKATAQRGSERVARDFVPWLRRHCKRVLWRPVWEAAKAGAFVDDDDGSSSASGAGGAEGDDDDDDDVGQAGLAQSGSGADGDGATMPKL